MNFIRGLFGKQGDSIPDASTSASGLQRDVKVAKETLLGKKPTTQEIQRVKPAQTNYGSTGITKR
jgi:hypothetical protein